MSAPPGNKNASRQPEELRRKELLRAERGTKHYRVQAGEKCGAPRRQDGGIPCKKPAGAGTDHLGFGLCRIHGGNQVNTRKHGLDDKIDSMMSVRHADPVEDPLTELAKLAGQIVEWKNMMMQRVAELNEWRFTDAKSSEQLRSEVALFERGMDRCQSALVAMAKLDIDSRLARISERQTEIVVSAMIATLTELALSPEDQQRARGLLVEHLRTV